LASIIRNELFSFRADLFHIWFETGEESGFHPERAPFRRGGVNLAYSTLRELWRLPFTPVRNPLVFLARTKNPSFWNRKPLVSHPVFPDGRERSGEGRGPKFV
jgi:hypothetical protein